MGERRLDVHARIAGAGRERVRLGGRQPRQVVPVDEEAPDLLERHHADQILDVDAPIAESTPRLVRLGDLGRKGDDAFEPGLNLGVRGRYSHLLTSFGYPFTIRRSAARRLP